MTKKDIELSKDESGKDYFAFATDLPPKTTSLRHIPRRPCC